MSWILYNGSFTWIDRQKGCASLLGTDRQRVHFTLVGTVKQRSHVSLVGTEKQKAMPRWLRLRGRLDHIPLGDTDKQGDHVWFTGTSRK